MTTKRWALRIKLVACATTINVITVARESRWSFFTHLPLKFCGFLQRIQHDQTISMMSSALYYYSTHPHIDDKVWRSHTFLISKKRWPCVNANICISAMRMLYAALPDSEDSYQFKPKALKGVYAVYLLRCGLHIEHSKYMLSWRLRGQPPPMSTALRESLDSLSRFSPQPVSHSAAPPLSTYTSSLQFCAPFHYAAASICIRCIKRSV